MQKYIKKVLINLTSLHELFNRQYYVRPTWIYILYPLSAIFKCLIFFRFYCYKKGILKKIKLDVPVIIIGNITLGGTGKTSLVLHLLDKFQNTNYKPGVISRGYGSKASLPNEVSIDSDFRDVGDEPLLIKSKYNIPVFVGKDKVRVANILLDKYPETNIIISDDGLQHYKLDRDLEIIVIDSERKFGNNYIFPMGPLREPKERINSADAVVVNGKVNNPNYFRMNYNADYLVNLINKSKLDIGKLRNKKNLAVTAIGNPCKFFNKLTQLGLIFNKLVFDDHYILNKSIFKGHEDSNIIMTEKDAIKCKCFARKNFWYLPANVEVDSNLFLTLIKKLGSK